MRTQSTFLTWGARHAVARAVTRPMMGIVSIVILGFTSGCSVSELTKVDTPSNIVAPENAATASGAIALYRGALTKFAGAYSGNLYNYTVTNGLLADEFVSTDAYNLRTSDATTEGGLGPFNQLAEARLNADRAVTALRLYGTTIPASFRAEMNALKGFVYVMIAELYCSGVPFSYVTPEERVVLGEPLTTSQMYQAAIVQFDSAIALATDSTRIRWLAMVGKGRTLTDLGRFTDAAHAVADVPANFVSKVEYAATTQLVSYWFIESTAFIVRESIAEREGGNGLPFTSAADPRLPLFQQGYLGIQPAYLPGQYVGAASIPIPLASGVEAQLIKAEAELQAGNTDWLTILNTLRTTCTSIASCATPAPAGTGGVGGLPPLDDPGSDTARVSLLFRERAFWMFGTGHRTGDLRRLIRQYGRLASQVFPVGVNPYAFTPPNVYGPNVNLEPPQDERNNPNYNGCFNRDA